MTTNNVIKMTNKAYTWEQREASQFAPGTSSGAHQVYFFRKSFEECRGKTINHLAQAVIQEAETKFGVAYSRDLQTLIIKDSVEPLQDPLLDAVFGLKDRFDQAEILDFYEKNAVVNEKDAMPFVDLCVVLGDVDRAEKFAERTGKDFEVLRILKESGGQRPSDVLKNYATQMWLEKGPLHKTTARLTSLIHRCAESRDGNILVPLVELWGEGYYWDVLCLVAILMPTNPVFNYMKNSILELLSENGNGVLAALLKWTFSQPLNETNKVGPVSTAFGNAHLKHLDALTVFRMVKVDIHRNEKHTSSDIEKLGVRGKCSQALRLVLLKAMVELGAEEAKSMADDAFVFVKKSFGDALADFFPNTERVLFQTFFGMLADVHSAVLRVLHPYTKTSSTLLGDNREALTNIIFAKWRKEHPEIWGKGGVWARTSFMATCHALLSRAGELEQVMEKTSDLQTMLKLAMRLCWLFASDDFELEKANIRCYMDVADSFNLPRDQAHIFAHAFAFNKNTEVTSCISNTDTASSAQVHHLTGDEFISTIKKIGINPPPTESVTVGVSAPATVQNGMKPAAGLKMESCMDLQTVVTKEAVEKKLVEIIRAPRINPLFHANTQLPTELERGQVVPVVSDDGIFDGKEVHTVWEAPREVVFPAEQRQETLNTAPLPVPTIQPTPVNIAPVVTQPVPVVVQPATVVTIQPAPVVVQPTPVTIQPAPVTILSAPVVVEAPRVTTAPIPIQASATAQGTVSRSQFSDDGWGASPSPSAVLPPAAPSQSFCNREQYDEQTRKIQQQQQAPVIASDVSHHPPIRAGMMSSLDALLYKGAGDAPPLNGVESRGTSRASSVAGAVDDNDSIPSSAAEMAGNSIHLQFPAVVNPLPPNPVPKPKFSMGGFEQFAGEGGFGKFGENGSLGPSNNRGPVGFHGGSNGARGGYGGPRGGRGGGYRA